MLKINVEAVFYGHAKSRCRVDWHTLKNVLFNVEAVFYGRVGRTCVVAQRLREERENPKQERFCALVTNASIFACPTRAPIPGCTVGDGERKKSESLPSRH